MKSKKTSKLSFQPPIGKIITSTFFYLKIRTVGSAFFHLFLKISVHIICFIKIGRKWPPQEYIFLTTSVSIDKP